jgi:release factor glutamine methyltransferase
MSTQVVPPKIKEIVDKTTIFFKQKNFHSPRLDAELLIAEVLKLKRIDLYLKFDQPLTEPEVSRCRDVVRRRAAGEPVAYILNRKEFFGFGFYVDPHVLIPRPETEILVEEVLEYLKTKSDPVRILDLGTGSGCIPLALLKSHNNAHAVLVDISDGALGVAQKNARDLEIAERCEFKLWNANESLTADFGMFDVITANPPYIDPESQDIEEAVKKFEPSVALFAAAKGLELIDKWSKAQTHLLQPGGLMIFEIGHDQGPAAQNLFEKLGVFSNIKILKDLAGHNRHIMGIKN